MEDSLPLSTEEKREEEEDDDPLKWEKMYFTPVNDDDDNSNNNNNDSDIGFSTTISNNNNNAGIITAAKTKSSLESTNSKIIRVITFDLDNTIWKTSETISDANDALAAHLLKTFGIVERSEKRMGHLFRQFPERYAGVDYDVSRMMESVDNNLKDSEDDSRDIAQNVGQSELQVRTTTTISQSERNKEDNGVHIQASLGVEHKMKMKPVYLTLLRKDAIRSLLLSKDDNRTTLPTSSSPLLDLEQQIDMAFDVWMEARCQSISKNFVPGAVATLQQLRSQQLVSPQTSPTTTATSSKIYIGAITDGNSNPNQVPELSGMFDFVIRAEDVGVSKPDARVYKAAVASLMVRLMQDGRSIEEFFLGEADESTPLATYLKVESRSRPLLNWKDIDEDAVEAFSGAVGPWWVHVGDDFFKDVVAAKEFQMRTVWSRELIGSSGISTDGNGSSSNVAANGNLIEARQRSVSDLVNDIAKSDDGILRMLIGPSEFLSQSIHTEFSDAILDRFEDLRDLVLEWQKESMIPQLNNKSNIIVEALASEEIKASAGGTKRIQSVEDKSREYKFCTSCGEKLPVEAKFCSSCGEKQM